MSQRVHARDRELPRRRRGTHHSVCPRRPCRHELVSVHNELLAQQRALDAGLADELQVVEGALRERHGQIDTWAEAIGHARSSRAEQRH